MVEEARLESVYTSKAYRGFESPSLRKKGKALLFFVQQGFTVCMLGMTKKIKGRSVSNCCYYAPFCLLFFR